MTETGIWTTEEEFSCHQFDSLLCETIIRVYPFKTAVDLGCGNGAYTKALNGAGISCTGYDGSPFTGGISNCYVADLSQPIDLGLYDLVLSLEVGEHIPERYERNFLDNLCCGPCIILSWAVPGQGGLGHVNERTNEYIRGVMRERGYELDVAESSFLRFRSTLQWFRETLMVYQWHGQRSWM